MSEFAKQMELDHPIQSSDINECPMNSSHTALQIRRDTELVFLNHKRLISQYSTNTSGTKELHLYCDEQEICFDDPDLFSFGEGLSKHDRFMAETATTWGEGYSWTRIKELLEQLLDEGILKGTSANESYTVPINHEACPSPLPPAKSLTPRHWFECESIMQELTGHPLEIGYLESIVPVTHIAHMALDTEERQVGEANVFPTQLRLDIPTVWRTCLHAGSRYQDVHPMNVTALKSMRGHWKPVLVAVKRIREAYFDRFPQARLGWTVGDLQRLASLVLTVPGYLMMRKQDRVENGKLHPVLSSMFRVTDGIRMTTHEMLYTSASYEPILAPDAPMTGAEIYAYAERNKLFHSTYGVCAGPKSMIEEFLNVLVDGQPIDDEDSVNFDPQVEAALNELDAAFKYGFYGLQSYALVFSVWPKLRHTYEQLLNIVETWPGEHSELFTTFQQRLRNSVQHFEDSINLSTEEFIMYREKVYADMYSQSANGLGSAFTGKTYKECLSPTYTAQHDEAAAQLHALLVKRLSTNNSHENSALKNCVNCIMNYLRLEQVVVQAVSEIQQRINILLDRSLPQKPLKADDFHLFYKFRAVHKRQPYLPDELMEILGIQITVTQDSIKISDRTTSSMV